jgi:hypothetical protein
MATKKTKKTIKSTVAMPAFNKKNAQAFGNSIFSDKGGVITCVKLCDGELYGKEGKHTLHCAVGEAYATFVNHSLKSVLQKDDEEDCYISKYNAMINSAGSTAAAIDALVEVAKLKNDNIIGRSDLASALDSCMLSNDGADGNDTVAYIERACNVAKTWNEEVVPLLK